MLVDNKQQIKKYLSEIPSMDDLFTLKSYDELEKIVNDWLNGDESETNDAGTTRGFSNNTVPNPPAPVKTADSTVKYKSLDDAFADLEDL